MSRETPPPLYLCLRNTQARRPQYNPSEGMSELGTILLDVPGEGQLEISRRNDMWRQARPH
jgi:hypothetical protein